MDIVTHAMIGFATSAGFYAPHPAFACGLVLGNVLPDLDAFSRLAGKHAFMRFHQTYTHSIAAIATPTVAAVALYLADSLIWAELAFGLATGMVMHVGLDLTNSYGVQLLWPIVHRRFALDWIFFIDLPIIVLSAFAILAAWLLQNSPLMLTFLSAIFVVVLLLMVMVRGIIALHVRNFVQDSSPTESKCVAIPTAISPFRFLICCANSEFAILRDLNVINRHARQEKVVKILDGTIASAIKETKEWLAMRQLSTFFHAVQQTEDSDETVVVCCDLRIRNFHTRFGTLTCRVDHEGHINEKKWEV